LTANGVGADGSSGRVVERRVVAVRVFVRKARVRQTPIAILEPRIELDEFASGIVERILFV
jgi:hypothetical protein